MAEMTDMELLAALGVEAEAKKPIKRTPREERIIAGFEDIQRFVDEHGRPPQHGEDRDIFERIYAVRLERIRGLTECRDVVLEVDHQGLLSDGDVTGTGVEEPTGAYDSDTALLDKLGVGDLGSDEITELKHVRSRAEKRAAEEIASREPCKDFDKFQPLFVALQHQLDDGRQVTREFRANAEIRQGDRFILGGQKVFVAKVGEEFITEYDRRDNRLRVIYDNGTESDILMRSLQRALHKDPTARRIIDTSPGPLFSGVPEEADLQSGTVYVLRSLSNDPFIAEHRDVVHKIGVTGGEVSKRIANARHDATYLLADVEVVATYELFNINRIKLENLIHGFFQAAKLDVQMQDRFGNPVAPREWFLIPLPAIDEMVQRVQDGTISAYRYDVESASLTQTT